MIHCPIQGWLDYTILDHRGKRLDPSRDEIAEILYFIQDGLFVNTDYDSDNDANMKSYEMVF